MTGRTHDLGAFTGLTLVFVQIPLVEMTLATMVAAVAANFIGGLAPDLDNSTSRIWKQIRGGSLIGKILAPIMGGHRMISHSLVGLFISGWLFEKFLGAISDVLIVDMTIVWWAFMIGMASHLVLDMVTKEGVPLLFPIPVEIGIPPVKRLRITTGKMIEKSIVFPGMMLLNGYLVFQNYGKVLDFLSNYLT